MKKKNVVGMPSMLGIQTAFSSLIRVEVSLVSELLQFVKAHSLRSQTSASQQLLKEVEQFKKFSHPSLYVGF